MGIPGLTPKELYDYQVLNGTTHVPEHWRTGKESQNADDTASVSLRGLDKVRVDMGDGTKEYGLHQLRGDAAFSKHSDGRVRLDVVNDDTRYFKAKDLENMVFGTSGRNIAVEVGEGVSGIRLLGSSDDTCINLGTDTWIRDFGNVETTGPKPHVVNHAGASRIVTGSTGGRYDTTNDARDYLAVVGDAAKEDLRWEREDNDRLRWSTQKRDYVSVDGGQTWPYFRERNGWWELSEDYSARSNAAQLTEALTTKYDLTDAQAQELVARYYYANGYLDGAKDGVLLAEYDRLARIQDTYDSYRWNDVRTTRWDLDDRFTCTWQTAGG